MSFVRKKRSFKIFSPKKLRKMGDERILKLQTLTKGETWFKISEKNLYVIEVRPLR